MSPVKERIVRTKDILDSDQEGDVLGVGIYSPGVLPMDTIPSGDLVRIL